MSESIRMLRFFAGIAAITSGIMGLSLWMPDEIEPMTKIIGFIIALGLGPVGVYLVSAIFQEHSNEAGGRSE